ncbi:Protein kinase-like domain protein [Cordyceps fumosorosea ARSEF 2679]|uniref:non-specific serine/threonine protein kinase n=1 Tax=Cordyceps fumosorosea (strain ARSEF 2679) TaxID=1081104 RepID=A0A162LJC7_CORFA|nr:Protein kinase-like domain protein [Cordyceps fumosorosea ARSEF 2679]OAA71334.1 Protein kinase-like domain protein [Cordyceps fumosorosea ARSEF 2679]
MASYGHQMPLRHAPQQQGHAAHSAGAAAPGPSYRPGGGGGPPAGTFAPGTKIQVGSHRVVIQKYLSEGGFAHVYLVRLPTPVEGTDLAVLKRVAVPDKESLRAMRTEVETMKRLKGHRPIVAYMDSHASELRGGGYEVFLLMEFCDGGGLIDFMNTRLQHRLTEPEILNIFADIAEGVACMHYLKPPLLHRDIKVENVLITTRSGGRRFMLCDFGSAAPPRPAPTSVVECRLMDEDVQKHTTLQYRSPEMVDVYRKQPLNEKADIWALGVFLYKLCYYTTPFEDQGQLAILNASYKFPSHPNFSDKIKRLIASMLREDLNVRPNIYQVVAEACTMQGRKIPIPDIYSGRSESASPTKTSRESHRDAPKPVVGVSVSAPVPSQEKLPDITPMRRGRPTPSPAPSQQTAASGASKLVTNGDPFAALDGKSSAVTNPSAPDDISDRFPSLDQFSLLHHKGSKFDFDPKSPTTAKPTVAPKVNMADKLADSAFAASRQAATAPIELERPHSVTPVVSKPSSQPPLPTRSTSVKPAASQPVNTRPVSIQPLPVSTTASRYVSTGTMTSDSPSERQQTAAAAPVQQTLQKPLMRSASVAVRPTPPTSSVQATRPQARPRTPETPKFENVRGYSDFKASRPRPVSTNFDSRQQSIPDRSKPSVANSQHSSLDRSDQSQNQGRALDEPKQSSNRSETNDFNTRPNDKPRDGAFGSAFSKFERDSNTAGDTKQPVQTWTPSRDPIILDKKVDESNDDNDEELTPEMRRERERLQLEEEEQRVAAAQSEYRQRLAGAAQGKKPAPGPKPSSIQDRVQAYMAEEQTQTSVPRTAEGYGKYADAATAASKTKPPIKRKPVLDGVARASTMPQAAAAAPKSDMSPTASAPSLTGLNKPTPRPPPKKPEYLNSIPTGAAAGGRSLSPVKSRMEDRPEQLVAEDLPGQPALQWSSQDKDDYLDDFSKRFPSLSAIEGGGSRR